jgi:HPt (histidine-containing phosphotransfer) domain-containing protein
MFDHLTKPIDFNQLGELLVRWIKPGVRSTIATRPPIEAPNALDSALPRIEGLDTTLGTQRVGGSVCLYLKLLRQFSAEHVDEVASIRQALAEGRAKDGERMAHSVKGAAASLGALTLADAAAVLERALRENSQEVAGLLVLFAEALDTLIAPLNRYFAVHEPVAAPKSSALEQPSVQQRLRLLLPLLLAGDSLAEEWVDALCADAQGAEWLPQIEQIAALIEDVEFELAYAKVEQLLGNLDQKVTA